MLKIQYINNFIPFKGIFLKSINVGEAYVVEDYRGTGLAEELLYFAENHAKKMGVAFSWVEHGTANPNAISYCIRFGKKVKTV